MYDNIFSLGRIGYMQIVCYLEPEMKRDHEIMWR